MYPISQYPPCPPFFLISTNIIVVTNFSYHYSSAAAALHKNLYTIYGIFSLSHFHRKKIRSNMKPEKNAFSATPKIRISKNTLLINTKIVSNTVYYNTVVVFCVIYTTPARHNQKKILFSFIFCYQTQPNIEQHYNHHHH